jgi:RNA polymerase sigma-70 factor (ECF subfamily)
MSADPSFTEFMRRIRSGDEEAARELVRRYEPAIRLEVRMGLRDRRLNRLFDSIDICQSVLASFFVRAATGQYDLENPEQLVRLLVAMARHKLASQARKYRSQTRDVRRQVEGGAAALDTVAGDPAASEVAAQRDLLQYVRAQLSEEERCLADRRAQGRAWAEIAAEMGGTPQARCKQLARAVERVARQLGLEDGA